MGNLGSWTSQLNIYLAPPPLPARGGYYLFSEPFKLGRKVSIPQEKLEGIVEKFELSLPCSLTNLPRFLY